MTSLHRKNAIVLLVVLVASPLLAAALGAALGPVVLGVALGGALQALNLILLERVVGALAGSAESGERTFVAAIVALRLVGLLLATGFVLFTLPVAPLAFALGLSTAVPASLWHGLAARALGEES